jgi:hypothetical protein
MQVVVLVHQMMRTGCCSFSGTSVLRSGTFCCVLLLMSLLKILLMNADTFSATDLLLLLLYRVMLVL